MMALPAVAALIFLLAAGPICFFVAYSDLARLKIPNIFVGALVVSYAVLGLIVLPLELYAFHWLHLFVVLGVGIVCYALGVMGAGDAKFAAAAAPMISLGDVSLFFVIFAACILAGLVGHRIAKYTRLKRVAPDWLSWSSGKRFPMGFPMAGALVTYLALAAIYGA